MQETAQGSSVHVSGDADEAPSEPVKPNAIDWNKVKLSEEMENTLRAVKRNKIKEKVSVYEGFGSFHSENVEDLINMTDAEYQVPQNLPTFAKRILSRDKLQQLGVMVPYGASAASVLGCKRSRDGEAHVDGPPAARISPAPSATPAVSSSTSAADPDENVSAGAHADEGTSLAVEDGEIPINSVMIASSKGDSELLRQLMDEPVAKCPMGREFREKHFMITENVTFINHGAFGSSLVGAAAIKRGYEDLMESEVVEFVDRQLLPLIVYSIRSLSRFLKADPRQIVLLQNATFALNCAVKLIEKDDVVAFLDTEYLSVYKMMWFRCQEVGASHHELSISRFLHDEKVMGDDAALAAEIVRQLPKGCTTVIVDCITSTSALCLPIFSHIIPALRAHGVHKIIVDGAHSPLQVDLNFNALPPESQPTIFVGNLHKWFSSPKSVGFFWVRAEDAENVHSVVLSHGAGDGLLSEFIWDGTRDYGAYLSVPAIVDFWESQDVARVRQYCTTLLESAAAMLTAAFHSRPVARHAPFMTLVELPELLQDSIVTAKYIQDLLHDVYAIEVPVKRVEGRHYLRISAFVYNSPEEYVFLKEAVLHIAERWFNSSERQELLQAAQSKAMGGTASQGDNAAVPCDERIRQQGGCGVSGLDPTLKRKKTRKF